MQVSVGKEQRVDLSSSSPFQSEFDHFATILGWRAIRACARRSTCAVSTFEAHEAGSLSAFPCRAAATIGRADSLVSSRSPQASKPLPLARSTTPIPLISSTCATRSGDLALRFIGFRSILVRDNRGIVKIPMMQIEWKANAAVASAVKSSHSFVTTTQRLSAGVMTCGTIESVNISENCIYLRTDPESSDAKRTITIVDDLTGRCGFPDWDDERHLNSLADTVVPKGVTVYKAVLSQQYYLDGSVWLPFDLPLTADDTVWQRSCPLAGRYSDSRRSRQEGTRNGIS